MVRGEERELRRGNKWGRVFVTISRARDWLWLLRVAYVITDLVSQKGVSSKFVLGDCQRPPLLRVYCTTVLGDARRLICQTPTLPDRHLGGPQLSFLSFVWILVSSVVVRAILYKPVLESPYYYLRLLKLMLLTFWECWYTRSHRHVNCSNTTLECWRTFVI